jgi:hypothetical protein
MSEMSRFEVALHSGAPFDDLRQLALTLVNEGHTPPSVLQLFEQARTLLQAQQREQDEDVVLEVMDCIVGWCSAHMALFPDYNWPDD